MDNVILVGGDEFREGCVSMDTYLLEKLDKPNPRVAIIPTAAANHQPQKAADNGVRYFNDLGKIAVRFIFYIVNLVWFLINRPYR